MVVPPSDASERAPQGGVRVSRTGPIRVLLADDHDILRDGLRALLGMAGDIEVVGEARTGRETIIEAERLQPDVVLMDITMPELDGIEACRRLRQQFPEMRVLFLTMHEAEEYFFRALRAGGSGYIVKRTVAADLMAAIRAVARGDSFLSPSVAHTLVSEYTGRAARSAQQSDAGSAPESSYQSLTSREREVLQLVAEGYSNQEIADQLQLSIKTVQSHRAAVMQKLSLKDITHLVRYAVRHGLINPEW
jgi:two-component system response regulator NreC